MDSHGRDLGPFGLPFQLSPISRGSHMNIFGAEVPFASLCGIEPVSYVSLIMDRFDHYRQFVVAERAVNRQP